MLSWHADAWANLNPGSVYNGLRSLARDGFVEEVGTEAQGGRPARTTYRLTADGETEFLRLLRDALWKVSLESADLMAASSFAAALKRDEVIAAVEHRGEQIEASARATGYAIEGIPGHPETPDTAAEHYRLVQARLDGEAARARQLLDRLRAGEYWFEGEPNRPWSSPETRGPRTQRGTAG